MTNKPASEPQASARRRHQCAKLITIAAYVPLPISTGAIKPWLRRSQHRPGEERRRCESALESIANELEHVAPQVTEVRPPLAIHLEAIQMVMEQQAEVARDALAQPASAEPNDR